MTDSPYSAAAVGKRIKLVREIRRWTQAELAQRAQVSRSDVSLWEIGKQRPSPEKGHKVCQALDIEMNYLLVGTTQHLRHEVAIEVIGKDREALTQN